MAKQQQMQIRVAESVEVTAVDNGDILAPLRRVYGQYTSKSIELKEKSKGHEHSAAVLAASDWYARQAENVLAVIVD